MWIEYVSIFAFGVAIGLVVYRFAINRTPINLETVTTAITDVDPLAERVESSVQIAVNAIEQARREGTYSTPDAMANEVINFVKEFVPQARGISNASITKFIKSAVLIASTMTHQIAAAKATVDEAKVKAAVATGGKAVLPETPASYLPPRFEKG